ncbi:hypothetical protein GQ54DRAFT_295012 [Martensiomyces pterosporus]|nr:hypothetical protein GQ54DRAFT_295012 [Martensiomyces pterosporus]
MEAEIPAASLKAFYRALQCLARIGTDVSFEARSDQLELIGINASRSAYASFKFRQQFFDAYYVAPLPASQPNPAFRCKVLSKPLVGIFKLRGPSPGHEIEKCILRIEQAVDPVHIGAGRRRQGDSVRGTQDSAASYQSGISLVNAEGECRLVVQMTYKQGICRTHRLFYEVCDTLHSVYDKNECKSRWRVSAKVAADWISHFARGLEEVSLRMSSRDVKVRSWAEGQYAGMGRTQIDAAVAETTRALQTELTVEPSEFDQYHISGSHPTELTFGLREFKAILQYAEAMALPLAAFFDKGGDPILFSVCSPRASDQSARGAYSQLPDDLSAEFVLATISDYASSFASPNGTPVGESTGSRAQNSRYAGTPQIKSFPRSRSGASMEHEADQVYIQNTITPRRAARNMDEISAHTESRTGGGTQQLHRQGDESIYDIIDPNIVPSPSPYQSSRASNNNREMWAGADMDIDKSDSLIRTPASASSISRRAVTATSSYGLPAPRIESGAGNRGGYASQPALEPTNPSSNDAGAGKTILQGTSTPVRSYRLLDMPRPQAPPGVTDSQHSDDSSGGSGAAEEKSMAPPGMVQTKLPYTSVAARNPAAQHAGNEHGSDTDMSSDEELDATPPPPSKRSRSLF